MIIGARSEATRQAEGNARGEAGGQRRNRVAAVHSKGSRCPATTLSFHAIFNYILCALYLGCQWKNLPIEKDQHGRREIHPTSIYRIFRRWQAEGYCQLVGRCAAEHAILRVANLSGKALQHRSARHAFPRLEGLGA